MVDCASKSVYSDELISATELNRQPGRVLDLALEHPVTITRNDHSFALLRREEMANLVKAAALSKVVVEMINVAYRLRLREEISSDHPYGWLKAFDTEELNELVTEIVDAFRQSSDMGDWDAFSALTHEWYESALAIDSLELKKAFSDELNEEVLLTQPTVGITT